MNTPTDVFTFAGGWLVMTAAMMLPSAVPFVFSFARSFGRDRLWPVAVALVMLAYLSVWLVIGLGLFALSMVVPMPVPSVVVSVVAVAVAVAYSVTPLRRIGAARCAEMCRRFDGGRAGALRSAVPRGARYGVDCVLCTAGVMLAVFIAGMSDVRLIAVGAAAVLVLKLKSWSAAMAPAA